jgi:uncharacterized membrane-anchored protein
MDHNENKKTTKLKSEGAGGGVLGYLAAALVGGIAYYIATKLMKQEKNK